MSLPETDTLSVTHSKEGAHACLTLKGIGKKFGETRVLNDISLEIMPGEVVALLGENGAGKSTLSNIISGVIPPSEGEMVWQGLPYAPMTPSEGLDSGIRLIHQEIRLLPELSIAENIFIGRQPMKGARIDTETMYKETLIQLERLGLQISPDCLVKIFRLLPSSRLKLGRPSPIRRNSSS
ncbi:ATP-binding cassette domain-containing protein [Vibrio sp. PP-XX7]